MAAGRGVVAQWNTKAPGVEQAAAPDPLPDRRPRPVQRSPFHAAIERGHASAATTDRSVANPLSVGGLSPTAAESPPIPSRDHRAQARVRTVPPLSPRLGPSWPFPVLSSPFFSCPVRPLGGRAATEKPGNVNEARLQPGHNRAVNYGRARAVACRGLLRVWRKCSRARPGVKV